MYQTLLFVFAKLLCANLSLIPYGATNGQKIEKNIVANLLLKSFVKT